MACPCPANGGQTYVSPRDGRHPRSRPKSIDRNNHSMDITEFLNRLLVSTLLLALCIRASELRAVGNEATPAYPNTQQMLIGQINAAMK